MAFFETWRRNRRIRREALLLINDLFPSTLIKESTIDIRITEVGGTHQLTCSINMGLLKTNQKNSQFDQMMQTCKHFITVAPDIVSSSQNRKDFLLSFQTLQLRSSPKILAKLFQETTKNDWDITTQNIDIPNDDDDFRAKYPGLLFQGTSLKDYHINEATRINVPSSVVERPTFQELREAGIISTDTQIDQETRSKITQITHINYAALKKFKTHQKRTILGVIKRLQKKASRLRRWGFFKKANPEKAACVDNICTDMREAVDGSSSSSSSTTTKTYDTELMTTILNKAKNDNWAPNANKPHKAPPLKQQRLRSFWKFPAFLAGMNLAKETPTHTEELITRSIAKLGKQ